MLTQSQSAAPCDTIQILQFLSLSALPQHGRKEVVSSSTVTTQLLHPLEGWAGSRDLFHNRTWVGKRKPNKRPRLWAIPAGWPCFAVNLAHLFLDTWSFPICSWSLWTPDCQLQGSPHGNAALQSKVFRKGEKSKKQNKQCSMLIETNNEVSEWVSDLVSQKSHASDCSGSFFSAPSSVDDWAHLSLI